MCVRADCLAPVMDGDQPAAAHPAAQQTRKRSAADLDAASEAVPSEAAMAPAQHADPAELPLDSDDSAAIMVESDASAGLEVSRAPRDPEAVLGDMFQALLAKLSTPHTRLGWSAAVWKADKKHAEIVVKRSPYLDRMGFVQQKARCLWIEEAVFLVERGDLILIKELPAAGPGKKRDLRPLSVQESLELLIASGYPLKHYRVYCFLARMGYIVFRHPAVPAQEVPPPAPPADPEARLAHRLPNLVPLRQSTAAHGAHGDTAALPMALDVWKPNKTFSRRAEIKPHFRVCITEDFFPSTAALARTAAANPGVTVLHAIVESDVDFFILEEQHTIDVWPQM